MTARRSRSGGSDLDARLVEAVPWVLEQYPDLDWKWLVPKVKLRNVQNRLGYLAALAIAVTERRPDLSAPAAVSRLTSALAELEKARLIAETTLGREGMTAAEKTWLRAHRPPAARYWNVLTSLTAEQLRFVKSRSRHKREFFPKVAPWTLRKAARI